MENVDPVAVISEGDEDMGVLDSGESSSYTETEDMTTTEDEDEEETREGRLEEVLRGMPENMELDMCPSGSNRMQYIHRVAAGVPAIVSNVHEDSDESLDLSCLDDELKMNAMARNDTHKMRFIRLVKEAVKKPTKRKSRKRPCPPTRIVEVAEKVPAPSIKVTEKVTVPWINNVAEKVPVASVNVAEKVPDPSVKVVEKEFTPVAPNFFHGKPTSSNVKTDSVTGGLIPNTCFLLPLHNQLCVSDIPKPRLFNPRTVCTLLRQDCMTLNMGPPLNQLRGITPSWMQEERREN